MTPYRFHSAAQRPVADHRFDGLYHLANLNFKERANLWKCYVYKHLFWFKLAIVLSSIVVEMTIQQLAVSGIEFYVS